MHASCQPWECLLPGLGHAACCTLISEARLMIVDSQIMLIGRLADLYLQLEDPKKSCSCLRRMKANPLHSTPAWTPAIPDSGTLYIFH